MDARPGLDQIPTHKFKQTNTILANWQLHSASTSLIECALLHSLFTKSVLLEDRSLFKSHFSRKCD
jgi:hypothetical protein